MLQAIGGVLNFKWLQDGKVEGGSFCDAQGESTSGYYSESRYDPHRTGILKIYGAVGVALNTIVSVLQLEIYFNQYKHNGLYFAYYRLLPSGHSGEYGCKGKIHQRHSPYVQSQQLGSLFQQLPLLVKSPIPTSWHQPR
jgi:hypothetical protein